MPEMAARTTDRGQPPSRTTAGRINIRANLDASSAFEARGRFPPLLRVGSWCCIHVVWFVADRSDRKDRLLRGASAVSAPELRQAVRWAHERTGVAPLLSVETGMLWTGCPSGGAYAVPAGGPAPAGGPDPSRSQPGCPRREIEPSAEAIRDWAKQAERDAGRRTGGLPLGRARRTRSITA